MQWKPTQKYLYLYNITNKMFLIFLCLICTSESLRVFETKPRIINNGRAKRSLNPVLQVKYYLICVIWMRKQGWQHWKVARLIKIVLVTLWQTDKYNNLYGIEAHWTSKSPHKISKVYLWKHLRKPQFSYKFQYISDRRAKLFVE